MTNSVSRWSVAAAALVLVAGIGLGAGDDHRKRKDSLPNHEGPQQNVVRENKVPGTIESTARRLTNRLRQEGYEVARGYFKLYTLEDCDLSYQVMQTCYGNNPAAPYVVPVVPAWTDEWVDPATQGAFGSTASGYSGSYRLDKRDAIVILGLLPPPADYFGIQTYLFTRPGQLKTTSFQYQAIEGNKPYMLETFFGVVPGNTDRLQLFANLSNSINNVVIENKSGEVWDQLRYFIITPDQTIDVALRQAFASVGIADEDIFTEAVSADVRIGLDAASDDLLTVIRYAMPGDGGDPGTPSDTWRQRLPLVVLRVRDTRVPYTLEPYPSVDYDRRTGTEPPEIVLAPDLTALAKAVCRKWDQPCDFDGNEFDTRVPAFLNTTLPPLLLRGDHCVDAGMNCLAPTEDTAYFLSGKLPLDYEHVYAAIGALSTRTNNATYVGLGLNSSLKKLAFENISDEDLDGSAEDYTEVPNHDKFFVQYFARDCSGLDDWIGKSDCFAIGDRLPACYDEWDLGCDMLVLSLRAYIRPGTERGVRPALALSPRFILLQRPSGRD